MGEEQNTGLGLELSVNAYGQESNMITGRICLRCEGEGDLE